MQLHPEGFPFLAPSICFICEQVPEGQVVDTLRTFEPNGPTALTGRKYVCESCVTTMGMQIGLTSDRALKDAKIEIQVLRQKIKEIKQKIAFIQEAAL